MLAKEIRKKDIARVREEHPGWSDKEIAEFVFMKGRLPAYNDERVQVN